VTRLFYIIFLLVSCQLWANSDTALHRAKLLSTVRDFHGALEVVETALKNDPARADLLRQKILLLASLQDEKSMLATWADFRKNHPEVAQNDHNQEEHLVEAVAWAVIRKAAQHPSPLIRFEAAYAAHRTHDAKGVSVVSELLQDQNVALRCMAAELAVAFRDEKLETKLILASQHDRSPPVRCAALISLGKMRSLKGRDVISARLRDMTASYAERQAAILAELYIQPTIERSSLEKLCQSKVPEERQLAADCIRIQQLGDCSDLLGPLIQDPSIDVQIAALQAQGGLPNCVNGITHQPLMHTEDGVLAITACWLDIIMGNTEGAAVLERWLGAENPAYRALSAGALMHTGARGIDLSKKWLEATTDPLVAINLSLHLIKQRTHLDTAVPILQEALIAVKDRITWSTKGIFRYIARADDLHSPLMPRLPEMKDLYCRLELYQVLATCDPSIIQDICTTFLHEHTLGIAAAAAMLLIQEADENTEVATQLSELLQNQSDVIRLQAAFILCVAFQDGEALKALQEAFSHTHTKREHKEQILLGLGAIGSKNSLPFLYDVLGDPSPVIRIRAAGAILQCLYQ